MSKSRDKQKAPNPAWGTAAARIKWLVEARFGGNRSALAKAVGFSHTIVGRVVAGAKPGRHLLDAVVTRLGVDRDWLDSGEGQPFPPERADGDRGIPVAKSPLPGPPLSHQPLLEGWIVVPEIVPSPTLYWLALKRGQPIVAKSSSGFRAGDLLLMETDPAKFPREADLFGDLCVVQAGGGGSVLRLATVEYRGWGGPDDEPAHIEADYHDAAKADQTVIEHVYRHYPNGDIRHSQNRRPPGRGEAPAAEPSAPTIRYTDIVSVWRRILRRPLA
jgi:hypothetical protein